MEKNKQLIVWGVVIAVVVIVLIIIGVNSNHPSPSTENTPSGTPTPTAVVQQSPTPTPKPTPKPAQAYTDAVKKYEGKRIQFEENCQASPNNVTYKNPATIMLDNRADKTAKVVINKVTYSLPAYGYKIITLNIANLPQNLLVDCNASQNVAQVLIQK